MKPVFLSPQWSDLPQIVVFSSTRNGGVSTGHCADFNLAGHVGDHEQQVAKNREILQRSLPGQPELQWLDQIHGTDVLHISQATEPLVADGLITQTAGIACCVMTADCLPVVLASEIGHEVAAVHAGWRGLAAGIVEQAVNEMDTASENIRAWLGPAINLCHFEVGEDVRDAFLASAVDSGSERLLRQCFQGGAKPEKFMADLRQLAKVRLAALGIKRVDDSALCSYCDSDRFFSYRRESQTGRNVTGIYLRP